MTTISDSASLVSRLSTVAHEPASNPEPIQLWNLPISPMTEAQAVAEVDRLIEAGDPSYFITANLNYAMLNDQRADVRRISRGAAFILADGMPLVWFARLQGKPLPARVAGSDLIYSLAENAARRGHRVFLLGGEPGVAEQAAKNLQALYPGLIIAGTMSPPFRPLSPEEDAGQIATIRAAQADLLLVAMGQPSGEKWVAEHAPLLWVPVCVQIGASLDFVAKRIKRAPRWMQATGTEWLYRFSLEPKRLGGRYWRNGLFFLKMLLLEGASRLQGDRPQPLVIPAIRKASESAMIA